MDLTRAVDGVVQAVRNSESVVAIGGRTQWEIGGRPDPATPVRAPAGVVAYDPAELTITVGGGTTLAELRSTVGAAGQEVGLDGADSATVGGVLAAGLSGPRRLRYGPVRDVALELRIVTGDGRVVKAGGPTVKNVTGYDVVRLLVGSLGTLGVIVQATLRCRPKPRAAQWFTTLKFPRDALARLYRPSALLATTTQLHVLLEGHPDDIRDQGAWMTPADGPPPQPMGEHRGRISIDPVGLDRLVRRLADRGVRHLAEWGVGTVHVAADRSNDLVVARAAARATGGWMLREAGAADIDAWGTPLPDLAIHRRIKAAFDPAGRLGKGRIPW